MDWFQIDWLKQEGPRPDWQMRRPFLVAWLTVVAVFFALDRRAGLLLLALLPLHYLGHRSCTGSA
jgi:hypothetical protein